MSATGDHDAGGLAHSVMLREGIRSWIDWVLGAGRRRAIFVHVMPEASTVDTWTVEEHKTRDRSFGLATLLLALAGMAFLTLVCVLMNLFISWRKRKLKSSDQDKIRRSFGVILSDKSGENVAKPPSNAVSAPVPSTPRQGPEAPLLDVHEVDDSGELNNGEISVEDAENSDAEDELEAAKLRVVGYNTQDLYFSVYHTLYCVGCLVVTGYAVLNDYLSKHFGLDYEFYLLWVLYIIFLHFVCLCHAFKHGVRIGEDVPNCWMAIPKSFIPSDGHLGVLRDAVTAGIYAQELFKRGGWDAVVLATITFVSTTCIFLPNVWIFRDVYPLRDFQECYWPIIIQADRRFSQLKRDAVPDKRGPITRALAPFKDFWETTEKRKWITQSRKWITQAVLRRLDENTRQHKQATSLLGDLPQVICGTTFLMRFSKPQSALFVFLATLIACIKTLLVLFLRAPTLCLMASYEVEWSHLTATDIRQGTIKFWLVKWILQSAACRLLLKNPETTMDARIEALRSLHKLHHKNHENDGKRKDLKTEELASEEDERMEARHAVLWEVAQQTDPRIQRIAKDFLDYDTKADAGQPGTEKTDWKTAAMQFRRLVNEVPGEKMEAMKQLTRDYPEFSPAFAKNLLEDLSRKTTKALNRVPAESQVIDIRDGGQNCACACLLSGIVASGEDCWDELCCCWPWGRSTMSVEASDCAEETAEEDNKAFAKEWRSMRDVRFAAAKALADLAIMSKHRDGDKKDKKVLTENQRSMALRAIKSVAPAVVERLDSNNPSISSAALVAVAAFRSQEEIEMAVKKAVELLKGETKGTAILQRHRGANHDSLHKMKDEKRKTGELVLVQLLPELNLESERETPTDLKGQEYWLDQIVACGFDSKPEREPEAATSRRVLERLGGRTAGLAKERLRKRSDLDLQGKDLLQVLEAQDKDLKNMNGDWRLCRCMNLNLAPREDSSVRSSLNESDLKEIAAGRELFEVLGKKSLAYHITTHDDPDPNRPEDDGVTHVLPVFFSDLEPDDTMFIAEMWKFLRKEEENSTRGTRVCCEPMVIFATDLAEKDIGLIFEKKLTLAALVLGKVDYRVVTPSPNASKTKQANSKDGKDGKDGSKDGTGTGKDADDKKDVDHRKVQRIGRLRDRNIKAIQERLRKFRGHVDFFVCAPGRGNLGEIVFGPDSSDKKFRQDLMRGKTFSVALYSGQFNVKNMEEDDLEGVLNLLEHVEKKEDKKEDKKEEKKDDKKDDKKGDKKEALMDVSKFPFWGGTEAHPATDGLSTFALPSFAPTVKCKYPEIAYLWSSFNDEFNCKLIHYEKLFGTAVLGAEVAEKKKEIKGLYDKQQITEYAKRILHDDELFKQVENRKRLTVKNFAYGCCDAPLCDQLIFVERWASVYQQFCQLWTDQESEQWEPSWVRTVKGKWHFDKRLNHTNVDPKSTIKGAPNGAQPEIQFSCNVMAIYRISEALQDYTLNHLQELRTEKFKLTPFEAKQIKVIT